MTSLMPGPIYAEGGYWDICKEERPKHYQKFIQERMAIQRIGKPTEIAELCLVLCSQMASFCVGTTLMVDGGQGRSFNY